jgi:hypothetical protein
MLRTGEFQDKNKETELSTGKNPRRKPGFQLAFHQTFGEEFTFQLVLNNLKHKAKYRTELLTN